LGWAGLVGDVGDFVAANEITPNMGRGIDTAGVNLAVVDISDS
jgi:hypothetical protein